MLMGSFDSGQHGGHGARGPAAARAVPRRHRGRRSHHGQCRQVGAGRAAEGPVRLPQLPDRRVVRPAKAVQYFGEIFKEAGSRPSVSCSCTATTSSARTMRKGFQAAHTAAKPVVGDRGRDLRGRSRPRTSPPRSRGPRRAKPDVIAPITRPASAQLLLPEIRKQRLDIMGIVGPGSPGLYEAGQLAVLEGRPRVRDGEHSVGELQESAHAEGGRGLSRSARAARPSTPTPGYSYDGMFLIADILERAKSTDPDTIVGQHEEDQLHERPHAVLRGPSSSTRSATTPTPSPP